MRYRQREVLEFRTPQHPSSGTNNWGGASPLLARNIPKESLEHKYTRFNSARTRDEIFPADHDYCLNHAGASKHEHGAKILKIRDSGILFKLLFQGKERTITLGSNWKKTIRIPRLDSKNRWPQGWCWMFDSTFSSMPYCHGRCSHVQSLNSASYQGVWINYSDVYVICHLLPCDLELPLQYKMFNLRQASDIMYLWVRGVLMSIW